MALASWVLAFAASHGWTGSFAPSESVVLVPAAIAVAACIGLGVSSFENDLAGRAFGWRQVVSALSVAALVVGILPVIAGSLNGRWDLPATGVEQPLAFLGHQDAAGSYRILWLGDPRALPVGGWSVQPGLSYALTDDRLPDASDVWTPAAPGPADLVGQAVRLAVTGGTVHLGRLLAAQGVRYVIIVDGLASSSSSLPTSVDAPPPEGITRAMLDQNDLQIIPGEFGVQVYESAEAIPITAQRQGPALPSTSLWSWPSAADVAGWRPVLSAVDRGSTATGTVSGGPVFAGLAPAGDFSLRVDGRAATRRPALGWAAQFNGVRPGNAVLSFGQIPFVPASVLVEVLAWAALAIALLGGIRRWRRPPASEDLA